MYQSLKLVLADGRQWVIRPVDDEAAAVVTELGNVMHLGFAGGTGGSGNDERDLWVAVAEESGESNWPETDVAGAVVCQLTAATDRDGLVVQMIRVATVIAREALARGGLLLHAALAEYHGSGFIMAGPGTVGKSTASSRLPAPWRSLCDDMTLVVRDGKGNLWAHPWPTWSRFWSNGPGGSWDVEQAVPLRAVFFLGQAAADKLEPVNVTQATAMVLESAVDLVREATLVADINAARALTGEGLGAAKALVLAVPAYSLKLSLTGRFWEEIEPILVKTEERGGRTEDGGRKREERRQETEERGWRTEGGGERTEDGGRGTEDRRGKTEDGGRKTGDRVPALVSAEGANLESSRFADGSLRVVCTGISMIPTLSDSDLLEVKPYGTTRVRRGDVVCFKSPETGKMIVHRVVSVGPRSPVSGRPPDGVRTRGDNNLSDDGVILQAGDMIGRVVAMQRGGERRVVHGGWRGPVVLRYARLARSIRWYIAPLPRVLYSYVAGLGFLDRLLPARFRPRLVRFTARYRVFLKLVSGKNAVGYYDDRCDEWHIRWPFRLFVKEQALRDTESQTPNPKPQ
jgi:signal peptidase I